MIEKGTTWIKHTGRFVLDGYFRLEEQGTAFTGLTPIADNLHLYAKDSAGITELFYKNSAGTERNLSGGLTGSGTANRLAYWSAAQVLAAVAALTQHRVLVADVNGLPTNGNALTAGSVLFGGTNGIPEDDNTNLFWNDTQKTLLIGTATARSTATILETTTTAVADPRGVTLQHFSASAESMQLNLVKGRGTFATPAAVSSADSLGAFLFRGYGSATVLHIGARIQAIAAENFTTGAAGTTLAFHTTPSAGILVAEKMRLLGDGDLIVGHTSVPFASLAGRGLSIVRSGTIAENCTYTFGVAGTSSQNRLVTARGVPGTPTATQSADTVAWSFVGFGATVFSGGRARIEAAATQNWSDTAEGAQLAFLTTPNDSVTTVERLRIEQSGDISHASGVRHRMLSQNRFRYLNILTRAKRTADQVIADATVTALLFDAEDFDTDTVHSIASLTDRFVAPIAGKYLAVGGVFLEQNTTGIRLIRIQSNANSNIAETRQDVSAANLGSAMVVSCIVSLAAAEYVRFLVFQNSGGNLNAEFDDGGPGTGFFTFGSLAYLGE